MILAGLLPRTVSDALVSARVRRDSVVMGTWLRIDLEHPGRAAALRATEAALGELERIDRALTTWDDRSPMGRLNRAPVGVAVSPGDEILDLLVEANDWAARTGGAFEPTVGPLIDAWGVRSGGRRPDPHTLAVARIATGRGAFVLDPAAGTATRRHASAWIDTGCFGKGAALRSAGRQLTAHGVRSALLDLGGQLLALGRAASSGDPWPVAVAHPSRRCESVARLLVEDASVSTSGNSERAGSAGGEPVGHIVDPRTGLPAPVWGSVTVVASDPLVADVLSTALYVMGPDAGLAWSRGLEDEGVLLLEEREGVLAGHCNAAMERWLVHSSVPVSIIPRIDAETDRR